MGHEKLTEQIPETDMVTDHVPDANAGHAPEARRVPETTAHAPAAHRPMRRAKREVTDSTELKAIIERAQVLRVGFADDEGIAVMPMNFGLEWNLDKQEGVREEDSRAEGNRAEATTAKGARAGDAQAGDVQAETTSTEGIQAPAPAGTGGVSSLPTFWLHSAGAGRKAEAWSRSPEVALELDVEGGVIGGDFSCAYSFAYASVMAWGRIHPVTDTAEKLRGLEALMAHMAPDAPVHFSPEAVAHVSVWRVDAERLTGKRREGMPVTHADVPASPDGALAHLPADTPSVLALSPASSDAATLADMPSELLAKGKKGKHKKGKKIDKPDVKEHKRATKQKAKAKHEKGGRKLADKDGKKTERKAREKRIEQELAGERCQGCGHHCKLVSPRCGKGRKIRGKRLAKAGLA